MLTRLSSASLKTFFVTSALVLLASGAWAADDSMCRAQATQLYNNCLAGAPTGGGDACRTQTRCEDLCLGGQRTCRVFDCKGIVVSSYNENCIPPAPQYICSSDFYENGTYVLPPEYDPQGSYCQSPGESTTEACTYTTEDGERACYNVTDTSNGGRKLVEKVCAPVYGAGYLSDIDLERMKAADARCDN